MFQFSSAQLLPDILDDFPQKLKENSIIRKLASFMIVIVVWLLPYIIASIPFLAFFNPNRQEWYNQHGFHGFDWKIEEQTIISYFIYAIIGLYLVYVGYVLRDI